MNTAGSASGARLGSVRTLLLGLALFVALGAQANPPTGTRASGGASTGRTTSNPPQAESAALAEENKALKAELTALKEGKSAAEKTAESLSTELRRLNTELLTIRQASANILQIQSERDNLQESVIHLERELEAVKRAKLAIDEDHRQAWFLIGAGVLLTGLILGLVLPQLSWRKKTGWDSF